MSSLVVWEQKEVLYANFQYQVISLMAFTVAGAPQHRRVLLSAVLYDCCNGHVDHALP